ncbi:hypothetical protein Drorol1_Dr00021282 [Drosera rotundifolia]
MQQQRQPSSLDQSPSFNSYSSNNLVTALNELNINQNDAVEEHRYDRVSDDDDSEFEFAVLSHDGEFEFPITADEIFSNGQIRPLFLPSESDPDARVSDPTDHNRQIRVPLKKLLIEERDFSCSSSEADDEIDLESLPPGTYCVWTPKAKKDDNQEDKIMMSEKSKSAGESSSRRRRLREFLLRRSTSDGTGESLVFVAPPKKKAEKSTTEKSTVAVVRGDVARYMEEKAAARGSDRRKTYLPYRRDVVGIFGIANGFGSKLL